MHAYPHCWRCSSLLIDRCGGIVTSDQAIGTLWEYRANDEATQSLYSKVGKSLQKQLEEVNAGDLVNASRGAKSISMDKLDCDLYQLLAGDRRVKEMYFGQYMVDYSWAEYRVPVLERYYFFAGLRQSDRDVRRRGRLSDTFFFGGNHYNPCTQRKNLHFRKLSSAFPVPAEFDHSRKRPSRMIGFSSSTVIRTVFRHQDIDSSA